MINITGQTNFLEEIIVDNFAGGGGASTGIELATGRIVDIAINHDPDAVLMHKTNHPYTKHYCESVWEVDPVEICGGRPVGLMWLSPDCKHFSRAKGGKPVSKNVRGLAWIAVKWAATVKPRVIILENVPEFVTWGPLDKRNRPDERQKGRTFNSFVNALKRHGYEVDWKEIKCCDLGAPTIRKRFVLVARCDGRPIVFPKATHGEGLKPYRTAAECIDWSIPCKSIFERKKPLVENTLRRIARGLDKFTIKSDKPFIVTCNHGGESFRGQDLDKPINTITQKCTDGVVVPHISKYYGGIVGAGIDTPLPTITQVDHNALVESHLCVLRKNMDCKSMTEPLSTITTSAGHFAKIDTKIIKYTGGQELYHWTEVRELLNKYCGYSLADNELLLLVINGEYCFIADIGMRMLEPRELYNAQGFPEDYIIDIDYKGNQYPRSKQVARCGNSVPPPLAEAMVRANLPEWCNIKIVNMAQLHNAVAYGGAK